jgi:hypothetical protein
MGLYVAALSAGLAVMAGTLMSTVREAPPHPPIRPVSTTTIGSCTFKKTEYAAASSLDESSSEEFVNLGDAGSIAFTQSGTGCVAGTFFANVANSASGDHVGLQVLLDGTPCAPLTDGYVFADTEYSSHAVGFFCGGGIAAGKHRIQVQYRSGFGGAVQFYQRILEVNHT